MLEFNFNWKLLSAIAGMTFWNFYFQLFPKTIRSAQVIEFLTHLKRHLPGKILMVWDRLPAHRSRAVAGLDRGSTRLGSRRVPAGVCAGAKPGGIPVGLLEAA